MKTQLFYGKPIPYDFDTILDQFSGTRTNSIRTSSIPLVQFWKQTELRINTLFNTLEVDTQKAILCFEYPTKPLKGKGNASMTDLMIFFNKSKIAIEAKFTEYSKMEPDFVKDWLLKTKNTHNREMVLDYWSSLIKPFSLGLDPKAIQRISYQFFHRTASACYDTENAIVVYQLFYDDQTISTLEDFKTKLKEYVNIINPNNKLNFFIWEIKVKQLLEDNKETNPFSIMKYSTVYEFDTMNLYKIK